MTNHPQESSEMLRTIAALANQEGFIELPDFVRCALYHPQFGYYRKSQQRVGRNSEADFFTASSLQAAFSRIVLEATVDLLEHAGFRSEETNWVELGAEPGAALLEGLAPPFRTVKAAGSGDALNLSGQCAVFSNELFDAQPFRQLRFSDGRWQEYGLRIESGALAWTPRPEPSLEAQVYLNQLPSQAIPGYTVDLPTGARALLRSILEAPWRGVFVAFDYGKTWNNLACETPQGTARGYRRHALVPNILETPGEQDITTHICWDHLEADLAAAGFTSLSLQSQEAFILKRAPRFLQEVFDASRSALDPLRRKLKELTHPALMGQKFQALSAVRL